MFLPLFIAFLVQGLLLGLVVLALLAAAPKLQKRYGPRWLCRLWVVLAVLFLVPVRALLPQAPAAVTVSAQPFYTQMTALTEETTTKPAANVPYRTTTADDNTMHYIVPARNCKPDGAPCWNVLPSIQTGATWRPSRGSLALPPWRCTSSAAMPSGVFAWAATRSRWLKAGVTPCRRANARKCRPRRWCAAPWWRGRCIPSCSSLRAKPSRVRNVCWPMN